MNRPRVFLDADVIFAGAASPTEHGASHVVLRMGEITLIECVTSTQVVVELERNSEAKLPSKLPELRLLLSRSLRVVPDPDPQDLEIRKGLADPKDLPILVAALNHGCRYLLTFNMRHYRPASGIAVQRPGDFLISIRSLIAQMSTGVVNEAARRIACDTPLAVEVGPGARDRGVRESAAAYSRWSFAEAAWTVSTVLAWMSSG